MVICKLNMALSAGDGSAATRSTARQRRQRSVTELKGDVLSLVRRTRHAIPSDSNSALYETHYRRFHDICSAWVVTIFASAENTPSASSPLMTTAVKQQQQKAQALADQLAELMQFVTYQQQRRGAGENREFVGVIVRSIGATTEIQRRRRKRKLSTAMQAISSMSAAPTTIEDANSDAARSRVEELFGVWLLHSSGVLRLEDVLLGVASSGATEPWGWLVAPVHFLLARTTQQLQLSSLPVPSTTHGVVEAVLLYVIRLAFTDPKSARAPFSSDDRSQGYTTSHASEQAAMQVLDELCFFTRVGFSIPTLRLVTQILSKRATMQDQQQPEPSASSFGRLVITRDRVTAFLQPQIEKLASPYSFVQAAYTHDELEEIFSAYESCLSTFTLVQVSFVQWKLWTSATV